VCFRRLVTQHCRRIQRFVRRTNNLHRKQAPSEKAKLKRGIPYQIHVTFKMSPGINRHIYFIDPVYSKYIYKGDLCIYIKNNRCESQNWSTTEIQIYGKYSNLINSGNVREYKQKLKYGETDNRSNHCSKKFAIHLFWTILKSWNTEQCFAIRNVRQQFVSCVSRFCLI